MFSPGCKRGYEYILLIIYIYIYNVDFPFLPVVSHNSYKDKDSGVDEFSFSDKKFPHGRQEHVYPALPLPSLLMTWRRTTPEHQSPRVEWYRCIRMSNFLMYYNVYTSESILILLMATPLMKPSVNRRKSFPVLIDCCSLFAHCINTRWPQGNIREHAPS